MDGEKKKLIISIAIHRRRCQSCLHFEASIGAAPEKREREKTRSGTVKVVAWSFQGASTEQGSLWSSDDKSTRCNYELLERSKAFLVFHLYYYT